MTNRMPRGLTPILLLAAALCAPTTRTHAQLNAVDFGSDRWQMVSATIDTRLDRTCLSGAAVLPDVVFENGVIEVDLLTTGARSYPGIIFRMQSGTDYERFYIRPHRSGLYPDAMQYTPVINGVAGWQLYNGDGYTAAAEILKGEWTHVKLEVHGSQARVFLGDGSEPALTVHHLEHGASSGMIGVYGPNDETACFANFTYRADDDLVFEDPPTAITPPGTITDWEVSRPHKAETVDRDQYPGFYAIFFAEWQKVSPKPSGLVDVAKYVARSEGGPDLVMARTTVRSDRRQQVTFSFGYSDEIDLFLNGHKVFAGNSSYQYRDPSFLGIVGLHDAVRLTLEPGLNEIALMVTETFGGWGFMGAIDGEIGPTVAAHHRMTKAWETPDEFLTPESVLYDPERDVLYVTSFDAQFTATPDFTGYISKVGLDGEIQELEWITDLNAPTGMSIYDDKLYVLERGYLTEIDIARGELRERYPIPGSDFVNDLIIDHRGNIYITDTSPSSHADSRIYRFRDGEFEVWYGGDEINRANGIFLHDNTLLVGNTGDGILKGIDLDTKVMADIVGLGAGVLDGIRVDNEGNYLVSHWEGQVYLVSPSGEVVEVLDTMEQRLNAADFEFIPESNLLIIPTFLGNRVVAYRLEAQ
jgi:sugar lactone lactonase YvrE